MLLHFLPFNVHLQVWIQILLLVFSACRVILAFSGSTELWHGLADVSRACTSDLFPCVYTWGSRISRRTWETSIYAEALLWKFALKHLFGTSTSLPQLLWRLWGVCWQQMMPRVWNCSSQLAIWGKGPWVSFCTSRRGACLLGSMAFR